MEAELAMYSASLGPVSDKIPCHGQYTSTGQFLEQETHGTISHDTRRDPYEGGHCAFRKLLWTT